MDSTVIQKVFISYSWTTTDHEEWVISLAKRLISDGIDVVLDKWDLKEGHDLYNFMESMVKSPEINKVLIILDNEYSSKAELRKGGVGTETQIISPEIYTDVSQEKFIPIVREKSEDGTPYIPTYLKGRVYIDLSEDHKFEENYEALIRNIYNRPSLRKPKLGKAPSYIFEESSNNYKTSHYVRSFNNQIERNPKRINSIIRDFLDCFFDLLKTDFQIKFESNNDIEIGKSICENLNQYQIMRDDFIIFWNEIIKSELEWNIDILIKFLENIPQLTQPLDNRSSWSNYEFDNFGFIIHEIFLYLIALGLKNQNYIFVDKVINATYFVDSKYVHEEESRSFDIFYNNISSINSYYSETHSQNFFSPMADFMIKRIPDIIDKYLLVQADLLCFYLADLNSLRWFPLTYVYDQKKSYSLFYRLESKSHFEKVKILFGVNDIEEFKDILTEKKESELAKRHNRVGYSGSFDTVIPIYSFMEIDKLCSKR